MAKKQINPIVIVAILAGIFLLGPQLGLFAVTEPENIKDFEDKLELIQEQDCWYMPEGGAENILCCNNKTDEVACHSTLTYFIAIQYKGNQLKNNTIPPFLCSEYLSEFINVDLIFFDNIKGIDVYQKYVDGIPYLLTFCSNDNQFIISAKNLTLLNKYVDTFYVKEKVSWWNQTLFPIGDFEFKLWMAIALFGLLLLIIILRR